MDRPDTVGALRASGHRLRGVKAEIRDNLLAALRRRARPVARHRRVRLHRAAAAGTGPDRRARRRAAGRAGPGQDPAAAHPGRPARRVDAGDRRLGARRAPATTRSPPASQRPAAELGDELPVGWRHRSERYTEKLATPDTAVADLIGDVDPVKVAEGRSLGDPETIHFGLVPRAHRGIMAINELPDLAERIQVALLNVMEERDIQVRGYTLRLPLDVLLVASANPEDYTNRGRIITPLKDRFGAEVRTHYPLELADEIAVDRAGGRAGAPVREHLLEISPGSPGCCGSRPRSTRVPGCPPGSPSPPPKPLPRRHFGGPRSPVRSRPMARPIDLEAALPVLRGKLEFVAGQEGREDEVPRTPAAPGHRRHRAPTGCAASTSTPLAEAVAAAPLRTGDRVAGGGGGRRAARVDGAAPRSRSGSARPAPRTRGRWRGRRAGAGTALPHPQADQGTERRRRHGELWLTGASHPAAHRPSRRGAPRGLRLRPVRRRARSARPAGRPARRAGRDRPRRDGGQLAAAGAAGAAPARASGPRAGWTS